MLFVKGDDVFVAKGFTHTVKSMIHGVDGIICITTVGGLVHPAEKLVARPSKLPFFILFPIFTLSGGLSLLLSGAFREDFESFRITTFFGTYLSGKAFQVLPVVAA